MLMLEVGYLILWGAIAFAAAFLVGRWLYSTDEKVVTRRKRAGQVAQIYSKFGYTEVPALLTDYSAGAYADLAENFDTYCKTVLKDDTALLAEINKTFGNMLDAQLATPEGLALVQAKIATLASPATPAK